MTRFCYVLFFLVCASVALSASDAQAQSLGLSVHAEVDVSRPHWTQDQPRPMLMHAFYPTSAEAKPLYFGPNQQKYFLTGYGQDNMPLTDLKLKHHPLVVLSHGNGAGATQLGWLAQALVKEGFIVIGLNHHGNTFIEPYLPQGFTHYWERPQDILFAIDWVLNESPYKNFIDENRIAVAGFSLGGYTVLATAGAVTDRNYFINDFCESSPLDGTCQPSLEMPNVREQYASLAAEPKVKASMKREKQSYLDKRIKAVVSISPPGHIFQPDSLSNIKLPTLILVGEKDQITPPKSNANYLAKNIAQAQYKEIASAGHYSMVSSCTPEGLKVMAPLCAEHHGRERIDIHREVTQLATQFLIEQLYESSSNQPPPGSPAIH